MKTSSHLAVSWDVIRCFGRCRSRHSRSLTALSVVALAQSAFALPPAAAEDADLEALKAQIDALADIVAAQAEEIEQLKRQTQIVQQETDTLIQVLPTAAQVPTERSASVDTGINAGRYEVGRVPDDAIVTAGDFEGSVSLPGSTASMRIGGYVQADIGYDFDSLGFSDSLNLR
ncbi:MAG: hypothetical protein AAF642_15550, partial [Pseudomonadota bacterium]